MPYQSIDPVIIFAFWSILGIFSSRNGIRIWIVIKLLYYGRLKHTWRCPSSEVMLSNADTTPTPKHQHWQQASLSLFPATDERVLDSEKVSGYRHQSSQLVCVHRWLGDNWSCSYSAFSNDDPVSLFLIASDDPYSGGEGAAASASIEPERLSDSTAWR